MTTVSTARENPRAIMGAVMRCIAAAKGNIELAALIAEKTRAPEAAKMVLRSGVPAQATDVLFTDTGAEQLVPFAMAAANWLPSLAATGALDRMAADALQLPFRQRFGIAVGTAEAVEV